MKRYGEKPEALNDKYGLLLQSTGNIDGQYSRIGSFDIDNWRPRSHNEEEALRRFRNLLGGEGAHESDLYGSNDYMRIEDAFKSMDLPVQMYESKNMAAMTYTFEVI